VEFDEFDDHDLDLQLTQAFAGTRAPARLAHTVMNRVRMPAPTRLPELLDAIASMGILAVAASVVFFVIFK
jgi:predicted RNA methylase